jgi:hypothetical protein
MTTAGIETRILKINMYSSRSVDWLVRILLQETGEQWSFALATLRRSVFQRQAALDVMCNQGVQPPPLTRGTNTLLRSVAKAQRRFAESFFPVLPLHHRTVDSSRRESNPVLVIFSDGLPTGSRAESVLARN